MTRTFTLLLMMLLMSVNLTGQTAKSLIGETTRTDTNDDYDDDPCAGVVGLKIKKKKNKESTAVVVTGGGHENPAKNCGGLGIFIEDCDGSNYLNNVEVINISFNNNPLMLFHFAHALLLEDDFCDFSSPIDIGSGLFFDVAIDYDINNYPNYFFGITSVMIVYRTEYSDGITLGTNVVIDTMVYDFTTSWEVSPEFKCFAPSPFPSRKTFEHIVVYPNPMFGAELNFSYELLTQAEVTVRLLDDQGNLVKMILEGEPQEIGEYEFQEEIFDLEGEQFYYLQFISEEEIINTRIFKT